MTRTFFAPRSFAPRYSLLGRAVRAWVDDDRLRGNALFIVVLTGLSLILVMSHYLGWALLQPVLTESPWTQTLFWGGQVVSILVLAGIGLVGFRPAVRVTCAAEHVELRQGDQTCSLPYTSITELDTISAQQYYRHYRRYAATQVFVSRLPDEVVLLQTKDGPVIIGLPDADAHTALLNHLRPRCTPSPEPVG